MIWTGGRLLLPEQLAIPLGDRIFEHGLGLFETCRTWNGQAPLLERHLARLARSALDLGIDLEGVPLPDPAAILGLTRATARPDALIRLTVSAGRPEGIRPTAWVTAGPLPRLRVGEGYRVVAAPWPVALNDQLARHKTLNYWSKRIAFEHAQAVGADEAIIASADGRIWEGSRTNLFLIHGRDLITPPTDGPLVPGIMRELVIEQARSSGFAVVETDVTEDRIATADEVFLTNSVRGLIPVTRWENRDLHPPTSPGRGTTQLARQIQVLLSNQSCLPP